MFVRNEYVPCDEVDEAVATDQRALADGCGAPRWVLQLNLSRAFYSRFRCRTTWPDLTRSIELARTALDGMDRGDPNRSVVASDLATSLLARGRPADRAEAESYGRVAAEGEPAAGSPEQAAQDAMFAYESYKATGAHAELDRAVRLLEDGLRRLPAGAPPRDILSANLAAVLLTRFQLDPAGGDLDAADRLLSGIVGADAHPGMAEVVATHRAEIAQLRRLRGEREAADIESFPEVEPSSMPGSMAPDIEALRLLQEYLRTSRLEDLDRAVAAQRAALAAPGLRSDQRAALLGNLSQCLLFRYQRLARPTDLDDAVRHAQKALEVGPTPHHRSAVLGNLGAALLQRHLARPGDHRGDLNDAINRLQEGCRWAAPRTWDHIGITVRLAQGLLVRFHRDRRDDDIARAIRLFRSALAAVPPKSPLIPTYEANVADALHVRALATGRPDHVREASDAFRQAVVHGLSGARYAAFTAGRQWAEWAWQRAAHAEAAEAYSLTLRAMHDIAAVQALRDDREVALAEAEGMAVRAAYAATAAGDPGAGAVALEGGRALMLSEALDRDRVELDRIAASGDPDLVEDYRRWVDRVMALEKTEAVSEPTPERNTRGTLLGGARAELERAIERIRGMPGHEHFLRPPDLDVLVAAARAQPLVYLAATERGGLALVLTGSPRRPVIPVRLPELTDDAVREYVRVLIDATGDYADRLRRGRPTAPAERAFDDMTSWMWRAMMGPTLAVLAGFRAEAVTLVPVGLLGMLPLHAAGVRDPSAVSGWRYALNERPLIYAPNARALLTARDRAAIVAGDGLLAVNDPFPISIAAWPLLSATAEVTTAMRHFDRTVVLAGPRATRGAVIDAMSRCAVHHFACHGEVVPHRPLQSRLFLAGREELTVRDVIALRLHGLRLAVLSACETAVPGDALPDEVVGLPAAFLQAGAAGVIGSLWPVRDDSTAALMMRFYQRWREAGRAPAAALRDAQLWLRDSTNGQKHAAAPDVDLLRPPTSVAAGWHDRRDHAHPFHWAAFALIGA